MLLKFTANVILAHRTDLLRTENRLDLADFTTTRTHVPATLIVQGEFRDLDTFLNTLEGYLPSDATIDDYGEAGDPV